MIANAAVVFPQPDSPTSPYDSPWPIAKDTPRRTRRSTPRTRVRDLQVLKLDGGVGHRSKSCAIASAIRLMPMMSVAIASEGKSTGHQ